MILSIKRSSRSVQLLAFSCVHEFLFCDGLIYRFLILQISFQFIILEFCLFSFFVIKRSLSFKGMKKRADNMEGYFLFLMEDPSPFLIKKLKKPSLQML